MSVPTINPEFTGQMPPERFRLADIADVQLLASETVGIDASRAPATVAEVRVIDPYVIEGCYEDPEAFEMVQREETVLNELAHVRRLQGKWQRRQEVAYDIKDGEIQNRIEWGDPVSSHELFKKSPVLAEWHNDVPSARALTPLADPTSIEDPLARKWMTNCTDAIGIRSRAAILAESAKAFIHDHPEKRDDMRWMSVACGTALPAMKAAMHANATPDLTLLDLDRTAMETTQQLGEEIGFQGKIDQRRANIFNKAAMQRLKAQLTAGGVDRRPDVMDLMGIFEYTGENLGVDPAEFLASNYDLVKDGGRMIFGQMRTDRPNLDFTMGAVRWPYVETRTPDEVMQIVQSAGIPTSCVRVYLPTDGVYMVVTIDKPPLAAEIDDFSQYFTTAA